MAATNKKRQLADYFVEGPGSSMEHRLEQGLHVVAAIIPIIAYVPRDLCWPAPARPLQLGHFDEQLSPLPGPARACQSVRALVATTQKVLPFAFLLPVFLEVEAVASTVLSMAYRSAICSMLAIHAFVIETK